jgi:hypothetical protein
VRTLTPTGNLWFQHWWDSTVRDEFQAKLPFLVSTIQVYNTIHSNSIILAGSEVRFCHVFASPAH